MRASIRILAILTPLATAACAGTLRVPQEHRTIQAAIAAAQAGDRIVVSPGTYRERLVLKPGISLISNGEDAAKNAGLARAEHTVIDGGGMTDTSPGVTMAEGTALDGFTVTGVGAFDEPLWKKHWEESGDHQEHAHIGALGVPAIFADGVSCRIENCIVRHNGHTGIALRGRKDFTIDPIVTGNRCFRNMGGGIGIMEGTGGVVRGNECYENFFAGIGHSGDATPLVTDNDCHGNVRAGIGVSDGACPVVRGNRCHANRRAGIGIRTGNRTRPVVDGNHCYENGMAGIGVEDGAEPVLRSNRCEKNGMAGIGAGSGAKPLIVANECRSNAAGGIGLGTGCEGILWRNLCEGNARIAIGLPDKARAIIADNQLSREGGLPPLVAVKGGSEAILTGNQLTGGGAAGILVEGRAILAGNHIEGAGTAPGPGIWLWKDSSALGADNTILGFKTVLTVAAGAQWVGAKP